MSELAVPCAPGPEETARRTRVWKVAAFLPLVLAAPWLVLGQAAGAPAEVRTLRVLLLLLLLASATITDLLWRRIYNWTTYTVLGWVVFLELVSLGLTAWTEQGTPGNCSSVVPLLGVLPWQESLAGFAAGFGIMFVLYNVFHGGAGDLKLVAVLGALLGVNRILATLVYSYLLAGLLAACLLVAVVGPAGILRLLLRAVGLSAWFVEPSAEASDCLKRRLPMAPFIAGGAILALLLG